ncbi:hypothetical protein FQR65_LT02132 [Abscondita terminalis]|nr:hypothetical protein FQR65_LT02132 [Abscondita terminalis]
MEQNIVSLPGSSKDVTVNLFDAENNTSYLLLVSPEESNRLNEDVQYGNEVLRQIQNYNTLSNEKETEQVQVDDQGNGSSNDKFFWSHNDTLLLITSVEAHYEELNHPKKRKYVWENINNDLVSHGINVTTSTCTQKWKNLLRSYKQCIDNTKRTGRGPMRFHYFDQMNEFLGNKPNMSSSHTIDTIIRTSFTATSESNSVSITESESSNMCDIQTADTTECLENNENLEPKSMPKRKNARSEYFKAKTQYYNLKRNDVEKKAQERNNYLKKKLDLEERKVKALEALLRHKTKESEQI